MPIIELSPPTEQEAQNGIIELTPPTATPPETPQITPIAAPALDGDGIEPTPLPSDKIPIEGPGAAIIGLGEGALALGSQAIGSQVAKTVGFLQSLIDPFAPEEKVLRNIQELEESLTFEPRTQPGEAVVNAVGDFLRPIGELIPTGEAAGNKALEVTGSPTIAGVVATWPILASEVLGFKAGQFIGKRKALAGPKQVAKALDEASPTISQLKEMSSGIYTELRDSGVTIKPGKMKELANNLNIKALEFGVDPQITRGASRTLEIINEAAEGGAKLPVSELNRLRQIAQNAAKGIENTADRAFALQIVDGIDDFLANAGSDVLDIPRGAPKNVASNYEVARKLWGRARRSEVIGDIVENIDIADLPFDRTMRGEIQKILKNKGKRKLFPASDIAEMQKITRGDKTASVAQFLSTFDIPSNQVLIPLVSTGVGVGAISALGPLGASLPIIGRVSKVLANRLTKNRARFADNVIRAGKNGREITEAYLEATPKRLRNPQELATLLLRQNIDLSDLPNIAVAAEARNLAVQNLALASGAGAGVVAGASREGQIP